MNEILTDRYGRHSALIRLKEVFSSDVRSLALFRMGTALLLIMDLLNRGRDITAHYTDSGVLPRSVVLEKMSPWLLSIHHISGVFPIQLLLFVIAGIFAIALLIGYKTRWATIASWCLLVSVQNRNPLVLQGGDDLLRLMLFWGMFLPLDKCWSLDRRLKDPPPAVEKTCCCIGTVGILAQVTILYVCAGLLKTGKEWYPDRTALYYALSLDQFTTHFGYFIYRFPTLMKILTHVVWSYWHIGPLLLLNPVRFGPVRTLAVFIFIGLQTGMGLSMRLGLFPLIAIVAMFPLLPQWFWDECLPWFGIRRFRDMNLSGIRRYFGLKDKQQLVITIIGAFFIVYVLLWNCQTLRIYNMPHRIEWIADVTGTAQNWKMFAPYPTKQDGWYVIPGRLRNGREVDLFKSLRGEGEPVNWDKPKMVSATYKNQRWRKYMMNLWLEKYKAYRAYYGDYLCREWNRTHPSTEQLESLQIVFVLETTPPPGDELQHKKVVIWKSDSAEEKTDETQAVEASVVEDKPMP